MRRAVRVWGGYGPSPTFRLLLQDGRRAFFKGINDESNPFMRTAHGREVRVYERLYDLIGPWAPAFRGAFEIAPWAVILLDDVGPKTVPPWTPQLARRIARALGEFHATTLGSALPDWVRGSDEASLGPAWLWGRAPEPGWLESLAGLAPGRSGDALRWLDTALPALASAAETLITAGPPFALLHGDVRSDNLRFVRGRLYLFDWPHISAGHPEYDAAGFAQSVAVEGGPAPDEVMAWYAERIQVRPEMLDASVASLAGFFADAAWREEIPGLPRLRGFQRRQLRITLGWAAQRLALPYPNWIDAIPG